MHLLPARLGLIALALRGLGCASAVPAEGAAPTATTDPTPPEASSPPAPLPPPTPSASSALTPLPTTAPAPAGSALPLAPPALVGPDEAGAEQRTFRQFMMGALPRSSRRTWTLSRSATAVRLRAVCHVPTAAGGLNHQSLKGREVDDSLWELSGWVDYAGKPPDAPTTPHLLTRSAGSEQGPCPGPARIELQCKPSTVSALAPGAALIPGRERPDGRMIPARWQPPGRTTAPALRCQITLDAADDKDWHYWLEPFTDPFFLMFTAPTPARPGVEWAFENSDMVVQQGDFRWIPATAASAPKR